MANVARCVFRGACNQFVKRRWLSFEKDAAVCWSLHRNYGQQSSTIPPYNENEFRAILGQHTGGSVDLNMDSTTGVALLTLNHPEKKNAFTGQMMLQLDAWVEELKNWDRGWAVVLTGAGKNFCSGGDLTLMREIFDPAMGFYMSVFMQTVLNQLLALPLLSVVAVQGKALGGGAELTTACDFRLLTENARVGFVQVRMGVTTGWGGGTRLTRLLGHQKALDVLASGQLMDARTAFALGFANHIIPESSNVAEAAQKWMIEKYGHTNHLLVRNMKRTVTAACNLDLESSFLNEREVFSETWGGAAQKAALDLNIKHEF